MAVVPCGETPSSDCGTFSASAAQIPFEFTSLNGNPMTMGEIMHGTCYTTVQGYDQYGIATNYAVANGIYATNRSWTIYPFKVEAKGIADISYNANGELIVTLNDVISTVVGSKVHGRSELIPAGFVHVGWAVNVKLLDSTRSNSNPPESDPGWIKCLGGWRSAPFNNFCGTYCPGGGTLYYWNDWNDFGEAYSMDGTHPTRRNTNLVFNLGRVNNHQTQLIAIYARSVRNANCVFSPADGDIQQCVLLSIPPVNICPPEINGLTHERDICEETINTVVNVTTPEFGTDGVNLVVMYEAINRESDWSDSKARTHTVYNVPENSTFDVALPDHLIPNTNYFFKIYLEKDGRKSDEIMVCDQWTPYMPAVGCLIPLFTQEECEILAGGDCLEELTAETAEECC